MIKILLLDHCILNSKVMEQDSIAFLKRKKIPHQHFIAQDTQKALEIIMTEHPHIVFVDISCEDFQGMQLIQTINDLHLSDLQIVGVTTLYDNKFRYVALKNKVYDFIYKPFDDKEIEHILEKYISSNYQEETMRTETEETEETEDFDDFFDFDDFDDNLDGDPSTDSITSDANLMSDFNKSHKKVSAVEFLSLYEDEDLSLDALEDLEENLDWLVSILLFENNIEQKIDEVINILEQYSRFLFTFSEFDELHYVLNSLVETLQDTDFSTLEKPQIVSKFIVAIIQDLVEWKEHLFIQQDAVDVYYINASILSSYLQLKSLLK